MQIIRSRPKFLDFKEDFKHKDINSSSDKVFINSGSHAIQWVLESYAKQTGRRLKVGVQSFNCESVANAVFQSDSEILLLDINLTDFSISNNTVEFVKQHIDVLILTHYQGIPNQEYEAITQTCKENGVLLIDDICLTEGSTINGIEVGTLGDVAIRSYAWDKPFTTMFGGSIQVNTDKVDLNPSKLEKEPRKTARRHFRQLFMKYELTKTSVYSTESPLELIYLAGLVPPLFYTNSLGIKLLYQLSKIFKQKEEDDILLLHSTKIEWILNQRLHFKIENPIVTKLEKHLTENDIELNQYPNSNIHWNRYSILDTDGKVVALLAKYPIEMGNYTWPKPLHKAFENHPKILNEKDEFPNSEMAAEKVLNIPVWYDFL